MKDLMTDINRRYVLRTSQVGTARDRQVRPRPETAITQNNVINACSGVRPTLARLENILPFS